MSDGARTTRYVTPLDVATELGLTSPSILALIHEGHLPATNVGRSSVRPRWRILREDLDRFIESRSSRSGGAQ